MSDDLEHIDTYFKENIDKVDVQYNDAHWEKLQKSLFTAAAVGTTTVVVISKWQTILKILKLYKLFFIVIPAAVIVTTSIFYFSKKDIETNTGSSVLITPQKNTDPTNAIFGDTLSQIQINNLFFIKPLSRVALDSPVYVSPYQIDTTKKNILIKPDSIVSAKKDTTQKKKNLNVFW